MRARHAQKKIAKPGRRQRRPCGSSRSGFSMLELEVALVVFGFGLTGLCPLVVMHSRQLKKLEERFSPATTYYLIPSSEAWARKLGAAASLSTENESSTQTAQTAVKDVQIISVEKSLLSEEVTAHVSVDTVSSGSG